MSIDSDETFYLSTEDKEYVLKLAKKIYNESLVESLDINEITQTAISALCEAVKSYQPTPGHSLQTYAYPRVRHALEEQLTDSGKPLTKKIINENYVLNEEENKRLTKDKKALHRKLSSFLS